MSTKTSDSKFLSVVIPAYNEQLIIKHTVSAIDSYLRSRDYEFEIIVVNDGSTDRTENVLQDLQSLNSSLTIVSHKKNQGKGYAVKQGVASARGRFILFFDADHSVNINHLEKFIDEMKRGADIVIGSIEVKGASAIDHNHIYRRFLGKMAKILIKLAVKNISDTQRGFKLFKKDVAHILFPGLTIKRWGFDIELLALAQRLNYKIVELPVVWENRSGSRVSILDYLITFIELIRVIYRFKVKSSNNLHRR